MRAYLSAWLVRVDTMAAKYALLAACAGLLAGCSTWPFSLWAPRPPQEAAAAQRPSDPALLKRMERLYGQGAAALGRNDLDAAIGAWREYAQIAPLQLPQTAQVRGYLTLLERESAKRFAKVAATREKSGAGAQTDRSHVALFPFQNLGSKPGTPAAASFNRAVMAMVTTDLARVPSLTVLEREKIDVLLQEQRLAASGLVDPGTVRAQGALLGAGTAIALSVYNAPGPDGPGSGRYRINTAVSDVQRGEVMGTQEADGGQREFFQLQKQIVYGILKTMNITDVPASVNVIHTRSWEAYARFATGLQLLAEDRFEEARLAFRAALDIDPAFALARESLLNTPSRVATLEDIKAELRAPR
jgi:tetratricopeptide (TPR) repeat protein